MRTAIAVFGMALGFWLLGPQAVHADPNGDPVTLSFQEKSGHFDVLGSFAVKADPKVAYDTLTDFESYPKFSHELKKVTVRDRTAGHMVVEETAESGFLFFTQKVYFLMDVRMIPDLVIVSVDTGHKSFVSYQSEWKIQPEETGGATLTYHLLAEGHFDGPVFMVDDAFKGGVKNFLENMRQEILRRQLTQNLTPGVASSAPRFDMARLQ